MRKSGARQDTQEGDDRERRRARSGRLPEPDQNPGYRAQFARQESSTEEEVLTSEEETATNQPQQPRGQPAASGVQHPEVRLMGNRSVGLAVREALVRAESGLNRILEMPIPGPRRRVVMERPLIGGRRVPIEDPVWESFDQFRDEHRAAVARQQQREQEQARNENDETDEGENIDR